jgi:hypothetical protein
MSYTNCIHHAVYTNYPYSYVFQPSSSYITEEEEERLVGDLKEQDKTETPLLPHIDSHKNHYFGYDDEFHDDEYSLIQHNNTHSRFHTRKEIPKQSHTLYLPYIRSSSSFQHIWRKPKNKIEEHNLILHRRLLNVKPVISSAELERDWKRNRQYTKFTSRFHKCNLIQSLSSLKRKEEKK